MCVCVCSQSFGPKPAVQERPASGFCQRTAQARSEGRSCVSQRAAKCAGVATTKQKHVRKPTFSQSSSFLNSTALRDFVVNMCDNEKFSRYECPCPHHKHWRLTQRDRDTGVATFTAPITLNVTLLLSHPEQGNCGCNVLLTQKESKLPTFVHIWHTRWGGGRVGFSGGAGCARVVLKGRSKGLERNN